MVSREELRVRDLQQTPQESSAAAKWIGIATMLQPVFYRQMLELERFLISSEFHLALRFETNFSLCMFADVSIGYVIHICHWHMQKFTHQSYRWNRESY